MSAFFSGTDSSELEDNSKNHQVYLSLIVNFDGKYCAKLAFCGKKAGHKYTFNSISNGVYEIATQESEALFTVDLIIQKPETFNKPEGLESRLEYIRKNKTWKHKKVYDDYNSTKRYSRTNSQLDLFSNNGYREYPFMDDSSTKEKKIFGGKKRGAITKTEARSFMAKVLDQDSLSERLLFTVIRDIETKSSYYERANIFSMAHVSLPVCFEAVFAEALTEDALEELSDVCFSILSDEFQDSPVADEMIDFMNSFVLHPNPK